MENSIIYYKIVKREPSDGHQYSSFSGTKYNGYDIGKTTRRKANCGPLAVFKDLHCVRLFYKYYLSVNTRQYAVFECTIKLSTEDCLYYNCGKILPRYACPYGTVFADEITLIREIEVR